MTCGTLSGRQRHIRRGESVCPSCKAGARQRPEKKTLRKEKDMTICREKYMVTGEKIISTVFDNRKHYMYCTVCEKDIIYG